jgi:hypothetical protein
VIIPPHALFGGIVSDFFPEYLTITNLLLFRFNSLSLSRIHLNDEYQGVVILKYSGKKSETIPPNSNITLPGYMDKQLPYHTTAAMVSITEGSIIPSDLDISPSLIEYR